MSCTVFKSNNVVDQSINVFPPKNMKSVARIVRNYDSDTSGVFKFKFENAAKFIAVGGTLSLSGGAPAIEIDFGGAGSDITKDFTFTLDEGREYGYIGWSNDEALVGDNLGSGAYPDYTLGLPSNEGQIWKIAQNSPLFNQVVKMWDVSHVIYGNHAFEGATKFNRDFANWNTSNFVSFGNFLKNAESFNQSINHLDTSKCIYAYSMMEGTKKFNRPVDQLDMSNCASFNRIFAYSGFNQPINWNMKSAVDISEMFRGSNFNQPVDFGTMPNLISAQDLFAESNFNSPVKFSAPILENARGWFYLCPKFNSTVTVDFSPVKSMQFFLYGAISFNQPISHFNIRNVLTFEGFALDATAFDQDLSPFAAKYNVNADIADVSVAPNWSTENYDKYLNAMWLDVGTTRQQAWANGTSPKVIKAAAKRSQASAAAMAGLIGAGWTIVDGGLV